MQLSTITVGVDIGDIDKYVFDACNQLRTFTVGGDIGDIDKFAFSHCNQLRTFTVGGDIGDIDKYAFDSYNQLSKITVNRREYELGDGNDKTEAVRNTVREAQNVDRIVAQRGRKEYYLHHALL